MNTKFLFLGSLAKGQETFLAQKHLLKLNDCKLNDCVYLKRNLSNKQFYIIFGIAAFRIMDGFNMHDWRSNLGFVEVATEGLIISALIVFPPF